MACCPARPPLCSHAQPPPPRAASHANSQQLRSRAPLDAEARQHLALKHVREGAVAEVVAEAGELDDRRVDRVELWGRF